MRKRPRDVQHVALHHSATRRLAALHTTGARCAVANPALRADFGAQGMEPRRAARAHVGVRELGRPLPHLHRDWARPGHICTGTGPTLPSAPALGSPAPHLYEDWGSPRTTSAPGLPRPCHLHQNAALSQIPRNDPHLHQAQGPGACRARAGRVPGARHAATQYNMLQRSAAHSPFSAT